MIKCSLVAQGDRLRVLLALAFGAEEVAITTRCVVAGWRDQYLSPWRPEHLRESNSFEVGVTALLPLIP
jgi:hypothetical protein